MMFSEGRSARWLTALILTRLCVPAPAAAEEREVPRPPRLISDARSFSRSIRPLQPRTSLALLAGHTWGAAEKGVSHDQGRWALVAEGAFGRTGLFLEIPVVLDVGHAQGLYGPGQASVAGLGDLRFGVDIAMLHRSLKGLPITLGAGVQITAPTGGQRQVDPETPFVLAPPVAFGPSLWALSGGVGLAVGPWRGLSVQLNADILGLLRDEPDRPQRKEDWLLGALALVISYRVLPWLTPLIQLDTQLEFIGMSPLRQILFLEPALRVRIHRRLAVDLGARIPLGSESEGEQQLSVSGAITVGLGRNGEEPW